MSFFRKKAELKPARSVPVERFADVMGEPPEDDVAPSRRLSQGGGAETDFPELADILPDVLQESGTPPEDLRRSVASEPATDPVEPMQLHPDSTEPFAARARLAQRQDSAPARRRMWDIEEGAAETPPRIDDVVAEPPVSEAPSQEEAELADDVALARAQIAKFAQSGLDHAAPASAGGRAKTRLLGFSAAALAERDPFAAQPEQSAQAAQQFPVGWIVIVEGPGRGGCFTLTSGVATIGREAGQTICLDFGDQSVSRQNHASIAFDDETNRFYLGHGGKSNIVRLNGRPVLSTEELCGGDTIRIGETSLRFVAFCGEDFLWTEQGDVAEGGDVAKL